MTGKLIAVLLVLSSCQVFGDDQQVPAPNIISRSDWGAREPTAEIETFKRKPRISFVIRHTGTKGCTTREACQEIVRSIQNNDMDVRKLPDIACNFLVGEDGNVYEGRGWDKLPEAGKFFNENSIGLCLIGNFVDHSPNQAATDAGKGLISYGKSIGKVSEIHSVFAFAPFITTPLDISKR